MNSLSPPYLRQICNLIPHNTDAYNLRRNNSLLVPFIRKDIFSKSFFPKTIREWNNLSADIKGSDSLNSFKNKHNLLVFQIEERKYFDPDDQRGYFAKYSEDLAMPKDKNYDSMFLELCNKRCDDAESGFNSQTDEFLLFIKENIENAMKKMNSGKAPDEYGLSAELFKLAKQFLTPIITNIFNQIMKEKSASFKTGIITHVFKKEGC